MVFLAFAVMTCKKSSDNNSNTSNGETVITLDSLAAKTPFRTDVYGKFTTLAGGPYKEYGICMSLTNHTPAVSDIKKIFTGQIYVCPIRDSVLGLEYDTTYYMRLYVVDNTNAVYSNMVSVKIPAAAPVTKNATNITVTAATLNGTVNAYGKTATVTFEYGPTASYGQSVHATPYTVTGSAPVNVHADLTGLNPYTTYHYRLTINYSGIGNVHGNDIQFVSGQIPAPTVTSTNASDLHYNRASMNGEVNANGYNTTVTFEYGTTLSYGNTKAATPGLVTGTSTHAVTAALTGLLPNTGYNYRVKAVSSGGTSVGSNIAFTTPSIPAPTATTLTASGITGHAATLRARINTHEVPCSVSFDWGTSTAYGQTGYVSGNLSTISDTVVQLDISGLNPQTTYHYRVKVSGAGGTTLGSDMTLSTAAAIHIGDSYAGGIVFYLDASQDHGMVCATSDLDIATFGCLYLYTQETGTAVGTGYDNTFWIVTSCGDPGSAAYECWYSSSGGYNDWYLPSKDELNLIYENLYVALGIGNFQDQQYWSSSEYSMIYAWCQYFWDGHTEAQDKTFGGYVRAVRSF